MSSLSLSLSLSLSHVHTPTLHDTQLLLAIRFVLSDETPEHREFLVRSVARGSRA